MTRIRADGRLLVALLWVGLLSAEHGVAREPSLEDRAVEAGALCKLGDSSHAAAALQELLEALDAEGEKGRPVVEIIQRYLACLEPDRQTTETASPTGEQTQLSDEMRRALRKLRPCGRSCLEPAKRRDCSADDFQVNLTRALEIARTGLTTDLTQAATLAECALKGARTSDQIMRANEAVAKIALQRGDKLRALRAAQDAAGAARLEADKGGGADMRVRVEMARLLTLVGDLDGAGAELELLESSATDSALRARLLMARGEYFLRLGSPSKALLYLSDALRQHETQFGRDHLSTAGVLQLLGDAHRRQRDFVGALSAYDKALAIRREKLGADHPESAATQNAIGVVYVDFKDWRKATEVFGSVASDLGNALGPTHPRTLSANLNHALASWGASSSTDAASRYREAVGALEMSLGSDHPEVAAATRSLARIELELGHPDAANRLLEKALSSQRRRLGDTHPDTTLTLLEQGQLLARSGRLDESAARLCAATLTLEGTFGREHPLVARYRMLLARVTIARGATTSCSETPGSSVASAWDEAQEAGRVVSLHLQRSFGAMTERQRQLFARDSLEVLGTVLSVPGAPVKETYLATFPHRDSVLRSIAASRADRGENSKTKALRVALQEKRRRYSAAVLGESAESARLAAGLGREIDELTAGVHRKFSFAPADPRELLNSACGHLPVDAAVIEFVEYDRTVQDTNVKTVPHFAAFVIRGDGCRISRVDLGPAAPITTAAQHLIQAIRSNRDPRNGAVDERRSKRGISAASRALEGQLGERSRELSRLLLAPLGEATQGTQRWFIVPDSRLWGVPIGALQDPLHEDQYLMDRVVVGYLTSIYELADYVQRQVPVFSKPLLFGSPEFGKSETGPRVLTSAGPCSLPPFKPLPGTLAELQSLRHGLGELTPMVIGPSATKQQFESLLRAKPSLIHLATHGYFAGQGACPSGRPSDDWTSNGIVDTNPLLLSGIVFAGANLTAQIDQERTSGIMTAYEVAGLDLRQTRLVVLSACDTGTGLHQRAQEVQGMRWGFRAAGANALVVSLWSADDNITPELMKIFYEALEKSESFDDVFRGASALNHAQREVGRRHRSQPDLWANFVFSGIL